MSSIIALVSKERRQWYKHLDKHGGTDPNSGEGPPGGHAVQRTDLEAN
jgi:hypothetical protein